MPAKPFNLCWRNHTLELGQRTRIMGILNVTPDSFSDGGKFFEKETAIAQAEQMVEDGADIIDIGGESSRPFSESVSIEEESRRVLPVIEILAKRLPVPISIDTSKSVIARRAISAGASVINDISALRFDPEMVDVAASSGAILVLMHMKGTPKNMQLSPAYDDLIGEIKNFFNQCIVKAIHRGISKSKIIVDPGIGFGKTVSHNIEIINKLDQFKSLDVPILIGTSRKAFIRKILIQKNNTELKPDHPLVEIGTQASIAAAVMRGVHIVRVHNVANTCATLKLLDAIKNSTCD